MGEGGRGETDRQTDRQTETDRQIQRQTERERTMSFGATTVACVRSIAFKERCLVFSDCNYSRGLLGLLH